MNGFRRRGWETEVVVCDNNSTDRTPDLARGRSKVVLSRSTRWSCPKYRASASTGEWLVFVDADSRPTVALFDAVAAAIESGRVIGGAVRCGWTGAASRFACDRNLELHEPLFSVDGRFVHLRRADRRLRTRGRIQSGVVCRGGDRSLKRLKPLARETGRARPSFIRRRC